VPELHKRDTVGVAPSKIVVTCRDRRLLLVPH